MLNLSFAKLVATPTGSSWSQAYNAGNLFACLSLTKKSEDEASSLQTIGKEIFSNLEAEFFTLEEKTLESIKEAISKSLSNPTEGIEANLTVCFFKENILYVFVSGGGSVIMRRNGKIGTLLENETGSHTQILTSSGFLKSDDTVILQTAQFAKDTDRDSLESALELDLPNDIAEALSPGMHMDPDNPKSEGSGAQAAIIIRYQSTVKPLEEKEDELPTEPELATETFTSEASHAEFENADGDLEIVDRQETEMTFDAEPVGGKEVKNNSSGSKLLHSLSLSLKIFYAKQKNRINLNHRNKIFISIAIIIAVLLFTSIFMTKKKQDDTKIQEQFHAVYDPALKNYEDGIGIQSINKDFAKADFLKAQQTLTNAKDQFKEGSKEDKQISDLLSKVNSELGGSSSASSKITPKTVSADSSELLSVEKDNTAIAFSKDKDAVDFLTDKAVVSVTGNKKKDLIKNDKDWEKGVGLSTYQGNIYILDQKNGVLKFTAGSGGYGKSSYLKEKPDLSSASAIAIDGSVWILLKNGTLLKYTRGASDGFSVKGLDKQMSGASRIFTNIDTENLYVLDNGNSRIVKINKEGGFQTSFVADILKTAKDLEVSEKDGKILVLSNGKIWEIPL